MGSTARSHPGGSYDVRSQSAANISNIGRDQHISYIQAQHDSFMRDVAATRTKARWLVWTGLIALVTGVVIYFWVMGAYFNAFVDMFESAGGPESMTFPRFQQVIGAGFGQKILGVNALVLGGALAVIGSLLLLVGIVLHIVATARRKSADRLLSGQPQIPSAAPQSWAPAAPPQSWAPAATPQQWSSPAAPPQQWAPATAAQPAVSQAAPQQWSSAAAPRAYDSGTQFHIGSQSSAVTNQVGGDQTINGGQYGLIATDPLRALDALRAAVRATPLPADVSEAAQRELAIAADGVSHPAPDLARTAGALERMTRGLKAAGGLTTAAAALIGPLQALGTWLGPLGVNLLDMLPKG